MKKYLNKETLAKTVDIETDFIISPYYLLKGNLEDFEDLEDSEIKPDIDVYDDELNYKLIFNGKYMGHYTCDGALRFCSPLEFINNFEYNKDYYDSIDEYLEDDLKFETFFLKGFKGSVKFTVTVKDNVFDEFIVYLEGEGVLQELEDDWDYKVYKRQEKLKTY